MELKIKQITLQTLLDFIDENDIYCDYVSFFIHFLGFHEYNLQLF